MAENLFLHTCLRTANDFLNSVHTPQCQIHRFTFPPPNLSLKE